MGVRTKVIPLTRQFTGVDPDFEASDDYLKTTIKIVSGPENVPERLNMSSKTDSNTRDVPEKTDTITSHIQLLALLRENSRISYDELAKITGQSRKTIQRHLQVLKSEGQIQRIGGAKGGHWQVML